MKRLANVAILIIALVAFLCAGCSWQSYVIGRLRVGMNRSTAESHLS